MRTSLVVLACTLLAAPSFGAGLSVRLRVTEPVGVARKNAPVSGGVPVGPLKVRDAWKLSVSDANGRDVPAQISPMVRLEDGTLSWVLVDFAADLKPRETKTFGLGGAWPGRRVAVLGAVHAANFPGSVVLQNELLKVVLSKKRFNLFDAATVNGKGLLAAKPPAALSIVRVKDKKTFTTRDGKVEKVALEDSGLIRTTVRVDGSFADGKGEHWLKYTARITMWAGSRNVRVLYAIRNVNPKLAQQEKIARASLTVKLADTADSADYLIGGSDVRMSRVTSGAKHTPKKSQWHSAVELLQVGPCEAVSGKSHRRFHHLVDYKTAGYRVVQHQPARRTPIVDMGFKCDGWLALDGGRGACLVWLRNFTYDNPKRVAARHDGTIALDLIPLDDGTPQPYYAKGGYWLGDRSHKTFEVWFHFTPRPFVTDADIAHWANQYDNYIPPLPVTAKRMTALVARMRHPLQLVSTPEWYTKTAALWGVMPSQADELAAAQTMGRTRLGPPEPRDPSWLGIDYFHYENFHYRSEWDDPRDCLVEFLRTRNWDYWRRMHSYARNYRDFGVPRTDGLTLGARGKGQWGAGPVSRWGKFCGCHNYGAGLLDVWLLTGDRSYRDAGVEYGYDHARMLKVWGGFGGKGRGWGRKMASVLATYKVTRDPKLKAWLIANCHPPVPSNDVREDGRGLTAGAYHGCWMTGLCHHAIWHNWVLHEHEYKGVEYDDYRDQLIGMARNVARYWWSDKLNGGPYYITFPPIKPGDEQATAPKFNGGGGAYTPTCVDMITRGYLLTGDPTLLAAAKKFWNANNPSKTVQTMRLQTIRGMGSNTFWCRQLIHELAHPRQDRSAPTQVTDLKAEAAGGGSVKLAWTAPKDDGKVVAYQVKHAPRPIVACDEYRPARDYTKKWTWWAGYNVAGEPKPGRPGTAQQMVIEGVPAGRRYFALRSRDAAPNESALSNVVAVDVR